MNYEDNLEETETPFPLTDATDNAILMHREVHFGGKFDLMIEYYESEGRGVVQEFDINRIRELNLIESKMKQDLAPLLLSGAEAEKIAEAKQIYQQLKTLYKGPDSPSKKFPKLIADLILAEEEDVDTAVEGIVTEKGAIVPILIDLVRSENFHDPLFPGYGLAPILATKCLGLIGDKRAIIALFESIGENDFIADDFALEALKNIGEPAKTFLLKVLHARPLTFDNERAAMALMGFKDDPEVVHKSLEMLKTLDLKKDFVLATDLILICEGLTDKEERKEFAALQHQQGIPTMIKKDIQAIVKSWES